MERMIDNLLDPVNRLYRHRVAQGLANLLKNTRITSYEMTLAHTLVGVMAAVLIYFKFYVLSVFCFELRTILDVTEGFLARMRNKFGRFDRILDTISDGISFNALMLAGAMRIIQDFPTYQPSLILIIIFCFALTAAQCGIIYQLMKRKILSILNSNIDTVESEYHQHWAELRTRNPSPLAKFGFWLDSLSIRFVSEEWYEKIQKRLHREDWEERALNDAVMMNELARTTRKNELRRAIRFTALLSDDNIFAVMSICFLILGLFPTQIFPYVHPVLITFSLGFVYAIIFLLLGLNYFHRFYHGVYRD